MKTLKPFVPGALAIAVTCFAANVAAQQPRGTAASAQRTSETTLAEWLVDKDARVSELVGMRVINPSGNDLGEVEDLLATPGRGEQEPVVVLSIGGVLDIGDKWHAVSLEQLRIASDNERLVLDKTEQELEDAPEFDYVPTQGEESPLPGVRGPNTTSSIGRLIGATVVVAEEPIGEIKDFVVSTGEQGTRAVVGLDDDAGGGGEGKLVSVPLDDLTIELSAEEARAVPQQARVRVELDGARVDSLPAYEYPQRDPI